MGNARFAILRRRDVELCPVPVHHAVKFGVDVQAGRYPEGHPPQDVACGFALTNDQLKALLGKLAAAFEKRIAKSRS
jgi:hypothetical protein